MAAEAGTPGAVEVRVYRHGEQVHRELCESAEHAQAFIDEWPEEQVSDLRFDVDDLTVRHAGTDVLDPDPEEPIEPDTES
jgi:hypothetical protein